jgi:hypothetical protein
VIRLRLIVDGRRSGPLIGTCSLGCATGTRRFYQANRAALGPLAGMLEQMWAGRLDRLAKLAESEEGSA